MPDTFLIFVYFIHKKVGLSPFSFEEGTDTCLGHHLLNKKQFSLQNSRKTVICEEQLLARNNESRSFVAR